MSIPLWRVTRTRPARSLYDSLTRVGVTVTRLREYRRPLGDDGVASELPAGLSLSTRVLDGAERRGEDCLSPGDAAVVARVDGRPVGQVFVGVDRPVWVPPLAAEVELSGAHVFRLRVAPHCRERGVAPELVAAACRVAAARGATRASALVAADDHPSQWAFEACGFEATRIHAYDRLFGWDRRASRRL